MLPRPLRLCGVCGDTLINADTRLRLRQSADPTGGRGIFLQIWAFLMEPKGLPKKFSPVLTSISVTPPPHGGTGADFRRTI